MTTRQQAAQYAILVTYAYDLYSNQSSFKPPLPQRLSKDYNLVAHLSANDSFLKVSDNVYYGFVIESISDVDHCYVVVRGTVTKSEFMINLNILDRKLDHPIMGRVDSGFFSIFKTMNYTSIDGEFVSVVDGIAKLLAIGKKVTLIGHSLGSAIGTYIAAELTQKTTHLDNFDCCFLASPRAGDDEFSKFVSSTINHIVYNFADDIVPHLPPKFIGYSDLKNTVVFESDLRVKKILNLFPSIMCNHGSIMYAALLDSTILSDILYLPKVDQDLCKSCIKS